ncbi:MAG: hypothetical protein A3A13_01705 [Candidatus Yanofskybacteria bacterium RIFCSPLOWO2_01_FULL_43_22]|uniref:Uncharacterized protein n=1 Tax=Candidatus Yanofskybacteria bacterium RIFCSPLOWO2_01_FULL_43_22 TaxID=1802695 RepID=A0A1F8GGS4_9BACT|nr:MAG: hypothetical protein A3A13_01705 [Candidatus Yanofskybacteria bacterium RIFCSPLOWO2_01_FULL_43_22]
MKKVHKVTIGKTVFLIEEDALKALDSFIQKIKNAFTSSVDSEEIISDLEFRIAEKLYIATNNGNRAITTDMVVIVQSEIGDPLDIVPSDLKTTHKADSFLEKSWYSIKKFFGELLVKFKERFPKFSTGVAENAGYFFSILLKLIGIVVVLVGIAILTIAVFLTAFLFGNLPSSELGEILKAIYTLIFSFGFLGLLFLISFVAAMLSLSGASIIAGASLVKNRNLFSALGIIALGGILVISAIVAGVILTLHLPEAINRGTELSCDLLERGVNIPFYHRDNYTEHINEHLNNWRVDHCGYLIE